jgi:transposase
MSTRKLFCRPKDSVTHVDFLNYLGVITTVFAETEDKILVEAEASEPVTICPHCGKEGTQTGNGTESQHFWEMPFGTKPCWVTFTKQLYTCTSCGNTHGRNLPFLPTPKSQTAPRLIRYIYELLDEGINYNRIARWTGLDDSTIRDIRDKLDAERAINGRTRLTSGFLGLDDWQHGRRRKMRGILVDVVDRMPITLFERITEDVLKEKLGEYLATHPEVKVIVIDMSDTFHPLLKNYFPRIVIVIDHYHVKQALEKLINGICEELAESVAPVKTEDIPPQQNLLGESDPPRPLTKGAKKKKTNPLAKQFRKYRRVWMKKPDERTERDRNLIKAWTATFPLFTEILERRDDLYRIYEFATSGRDAKRKFLAWRKSLSADVAKQYAPFIQMVITWGKEIAAFFDFPLRPTNGFTESMVREVKRWNDEGRWVSFRVLCARFEHYVPKSHLEQN